MIELRESTANQEVPLGYFLDSTNGDDEEGSLTINNTDIKIWKWGATSLVNKNSGGATHMSNGIYYIVLDATDTNTVGPGVIFVHVAGALAVRLEFAVLPANVWDSKYGSDKLQVDVTQVGGDTQSATDLKDFADTGYDPSTHKVQGVVLTDTCTTNTDMRGTDNAATASALSTHDGKLDTVDSNVDAIKAKTDNLNFNSDGTPLVLADIRDVNDSAVSGVNDFKADVTNLDVAVSSRSSHSAADVWAVGTRALTDKSNFNLASDQSGVTIGTVNALGTQAKADVNAEVDNALNTEIPGSPTANSINERIKAIDDKLPAGTISDFDNSSDQVIVGTNNDKTGYSISGTKTTLDALNDISTADVNSEVDTALSDIGLDHLVGASVTGTDVVDNSIIAKLVSKSGTADWDDFDNTTDSLEAIRDRGDAAWTTGSGTGLTALASGTAQDGGNNSITLAAGESSTNDIYKGARIALVGGTGAGQARIITAYNGSTKEATVSPNWVTNPNSSTDYEIQAADSTLGTIQNDVQSVTDLKDLVDTGYDPSAHKIQGVVLTDTTNALGTQAKSDVNAEVDTALSDIGLDHLISASVTGTDITDDSIIAKLVSKSATADWDNFDNTTDSLQAIRDALVDASPLGHSATANSEEGNTVLVDGDYTDTATADGVNYYETSPGAAVGGFGLDCNLTFGIGTGRIPSVVVVRGHFDAGAQRTVQVWAYNYNTSSYDQISNSTNDFGNSGTDTTEEYALGIDNVKISDGEVKIRFTSTSETGTDVWYCDYVNVASVAQEAAGLTADTIQKAVWARSSTNDSHDDGTLGYNLSRVFLVQGDVVSATDATKFIIDSGSSVDNAYNGMIITLEDKTDGHYETRRIIDYTGSTKEITVDRAFGFTPAAGDEYYILNAYADVNVTHISGTAQTANDNGADINAILEDTNELQTNQGNWVTATGFATSAELKHA